MKKFALVIFAVCVFSLGYGYNVQAERITLALKVSEIFIPRAQKVIVHNGELKTVPLFFANSWREIVFESKSLGAESTIFNLSLINETGTKDGTLVNASYEQLLQWRPSVGNGETSLTISVSGLHQEEPLEITYTVFN